MSETLSQLGQLFVQSVPTVVFLFLLLLILDRLFFRPLSRVLEEREASTTGALARAREQVAAAEVKAREYEAAFQAARQEVYRLREAERRAVLAERETALKQSREQADAWLNNAQATVAREAEAARHELTRSCQSLAQVIAEAILIPPSGTADRREGARR